MTKPTLSEKERAQLEAIFASRGIADYKWISPAEIVVAEWVRMKCRFGCDNYGHYGTCPPNVPTVAECRAFFREYALAALVRFEKQEPDHATRRKWSNEMILEFVALERDVFLAGYEKAFAMPFATCHLCADCTVSRESCKLPYKARPSPEALAVDLFATVRAQGYPIEVVTALDEPQNRYAIVLVR